MKVGTSYFTCREKANQYYAEYGLSASDVERKLREGEIHIGKPDLKPGELLTTTDNYARYAVEKLITRKEYMSDSKNLHQAYYLEMAKHAGLTVGNLPVGLDQIREALKTDEHMNNIPLGKWDARVTPSVRHAIAQVNIAKEGYCASSLSDGVCALKALARHLATA